MTTSNTSLSPAREAVDAEYGLQRARRRGFGWKWVKTLLGGVVLTGLAAGLAGIRWGNESMAPVIAGGLLLTAMVALQQIRAQGREEIQLETQTAVERVAGPVTEFRMTGWRGWFYGRSTRVRFRYQPAAVITDPTWPDPLPKVLNAMSDPNKPTEFRVTRIDLRRGRVKLRGRPAIAAAAEVDDRTEDQMRVDRLTGMCNDIFDDRETKANVQVSVADDGAITAVEVAHHVPLKTAIPRVRDQIERVIGSTQRGRWRAQWDLENDHVRFELRPKMPKLVLRQPPAKVPVPKVEVHLIPIGVDEDGELMAWNLKSSAPHMLVVGKTGKGKTNFLKGIAREAVSRGYAVWGADPKRMELRELSRLRGVQVVATRIEHIVALVVVAYNLMEDRYRQMEDHGAKPTDFEKLIFIFDEYGEFAVRVNYWWQRVKRRMTKPPAQCPVLEMYDSLSRLARKAQIHMVVGLQRPDVRFFGGGEGRDNFDARVSLGRLSPDGSEMTWDSAIGTTVPQVPGRAIAAGGDREPAEVQTLFIPEVDFSDTWSEDEATLMEQWEEAIETAAQANKYAHPKLRLEIPPPLIDLDSEAEPSPEDLEPGWEEVSQASLVPVDPEDDDPEDDADRADDAELAVALEAFRHPEGGGDDEGYADPINASPDQIEMGDLVETDADEWAVVADNPGKDPDTGEWIITWRSLDDRTGDIELPDESMITIRKPATAPAPHLRLITNQMEDNDG